VKYFPSVATVNEVSNKENNVFDKIFFDKIDKITINRIKIDYYFIF